MVVFLSRLTGYRPTKRNLPSATGAELSTIRSGRSGSAYRAAISKIRMKAPSSIMMRLQTTGTRLDAGYSTDGEPDFLDVEEEMIEERGI